MEIESKIQTLNRKEQIRNSVLVIMSFLIAFYGKNLFNLLIEIKFETYFTKIVYAYAWWIIPPVLVLILLFGYKNILKELRLEKGIVFGLGFALITVSPMLISSALFGSIQKPIDYLSLIHTTVLAGFFEEVVFRAFLFGILFRKLNWAFVPASIIGALVFGFGHLYQGSTFVEILGIFTVTAMGAIWFSWLFIEWNENIWVSIFLHILMNLSWVLFEVEENALGGLYSNLFRVITIGLTVTLTIIKCKRKGKFSINKNNLFKVSLLKYP